ncbi:MAG TPA: DNA-formamidopyrimidine glycosylase family protein, partial [Candidatus Limnocylindrales bacterium]
MPEGDTLARIAVALRPYLAGRVVTGARARLPGPQVSRIVGQKIDAVDAAGKNLLIKFDGGLELRTHLGLHGSWHRYRPGETWRRPPSRAALVIEVPGAIAVCFDAPVVELFERRAEVVHPTISMLGPDLVDNSYDQAEAVRRLRDPSRAQTAIGEAVLDQRAVAGIGNVFKSEVLFMEKVDPFALVGTLDEETIERILSTARD